MSATYIDGNFFSNGGVAVTSAPVIRPAAADTGQLLLAFVCVGNLNPVTAPSGFDQVDVQVNTVLSMQTRVYQKYIVDIGTEPASYTWTFSSGAVSAVVECWESVGFVYLASQDADSLSLLSHDTPTVNNQLEDVRVVSCFTASSLLTVGWAPDTGDTERFDAIGGLPVLLNVNMMVADSPALIGPGTVSRTATTVASVQGLAAIVLLAAVPELGIFGTDNPVMETSSFARTLMSTPLGELTAADPVLDLDDCIGQRTATYRFDVVDIVTGYRTQVYPLADTAPTLTHDTTRTIKRSISGLEFGVEETAALNATSGRLEIFMIIAGQSFPLGQYIFVDQTRARYTSGLLSSSAFYDNGFIIDQDLEHAFPVVSLQGASSGATSVDVLIAALLAMYPVTFTQEGTPFQSAGSWSAGTSGGYTLEQLAIDGDYLSPWFDHTNVCRLIRAFDPADVLPRFDFDAGNKVMENPVPIETDDLLTAPNRFILISNGSTTTSTPVTGQYDVPNSAPHSIANRGFVIPKVIDRQIEAPSQANAIAANIGQRMTVFERATVSTAPDPRHDSYDVIRWQGENWLELGWSMTLREGAPMRHSMRKVYTP